MQYVNVIGACKKKSLTKNLLIDSFTSFQKWLLENVLHTNRIDNEQNRRTYSFFHPLTEHS